MSGSAFALPSVAFLAVYREGVETVLFYKALLVAGPGRRRSVAGAPRHRCRLGGAGRGLCADQPLRRAAAAQAVLRRHQRVPLLHGVRLSGEGHRGAAGWRASCRSPWCSWAPQIERLGIYRTVESLTAQGILLLLFVGALVWTFYLEPRRLRVTQELVPEPVPVVPATLADVPAADGAARGPFEVDLLRSLERMDADLAELRAEVERLKARLHARR